MSHQLCGRFLSFPQMLNLTQKDLVARVVDHVDIAAPAPAADSWYVEVGKDEPARFASKNTGRGPLQEGWQVSGWFQTACMWFRDQLGCVSKGRPSVEAPEVWRPRVSLRKGVCCGYR